MKNLGAVLATDERSVFVVKLTRAFRPRLERELDVADEIAAPGLVDARAEFGLHAFELFLPRFAIGGDFEAAVFIAERARARGESFAYDLRPGTGEPGESGFGAVEAAQRTSEEVSRAFHKLADSSTSLARRNPQERDSTFSEARRTRSRS